jgi:hypothetical protein
VKKLVAATEATDYNVLQNNGTIAHQQVHHVRLMTPTPHEANGNLVVLIWSGTLPHGMLASA